MWASIGIRRGVSSHIERLSSISSLSPSREKRPKGGGLTALLCPFFLSLPFLSLQFGPANGLTSAHIRSPSSSSSSFDAFFSLVSHNPRRSTFSSYLGISFLISPLDIIYFHVCRRVAYMCPLQLCCFPAYPLQFCRCFWNSWHAPIGKSYPRGL